MSQSSLQHAMTMLCPDYKHVLEFGVCRGATMQIIRKTLDSSFGVFGFDSFEGLPEDWIDKHGKTVVNKGHFSTQKEIPNIPNVKFYPGWFKDTLLEYLKIAQPIALLHIDCDIYSSAKEILFALNQYILPGTIIVFDEWFYRHDKQYNDHEQKAFFEWVAAFNRDYVEASFIDLTTSGEERKIIRILK